MKTQFKFERENGYFWDKDYSPQEGNSLWASCPMLAMLQDPSVGHVYDEHFDTYVAGDWTITEVGSGSQALANEAGGVLLLTTGATENNGPNYNKKGESWKLAAGKPLWYEIKLKISDATQSDFLVGLSITDTEMLGAVTDDVSFRKIDESASVSFVTEKNSTETTTASVHTMVADTYVRLGFFFDGAGTIYAYVNGVLVATHTTNIPDDEELCVAFQVTTGEAVAKTMSIDYIRVAQIL